MKPINKNAVYIWQRPEWPNFRWDSDKLLAPLAHLNHLHGLLTGQMLLLGFDDRSETQLKALTNELLNSSEIEGIMLNADSVRSSIARKLGLDTNKQLTENHYVESLVDIMLDATTHPRESLTDERLFGWHCALFPTGRSGIYKITIGDWRQGEEPMQVVSGALGHEKVHYEAPPSITVPEEMTRFIQWCNTNTQPPFIKAAIAHLWFVTIHPFDDGNGRLGRTITDMFLSEMDKNNARFYSMSAEINRNKKSYYDILERSQKGSMDITEWLLWFFDCLEKALLRTQHTITHTLQKAVFWDKFHEVPVNERQRKIINRLWDGFEGKLTSSKWAKICNCSPDTALRDINDLISKGMLRDSGEGGRSTNYILT
ncbi:MAG: Fic family protein [Oscillibacter sp.]|nr:Fic family protein [Oscillibacter sp.]